MLAEISVIFVVVFCAWLWHSTARERKLIEKFPGPRAYPIVGNITKLRKSSAEFFSDFNEYAEEFEKDGVPFRFLVGKPSYISAIVLTDPNDFEIILSSNKEIEKGKVYNPLIPWLGAGLWINEGSKWRSRRKILTPCFHYSLLDEFLHIFNANAKILVQKLENRVNEPAFDIQKYFALCALDTICETAMGVKMNAQNERKSEYIEAVHQMNEIILELSIIKPWLRISFLFNMSKYKPIYDKSLNILHTSTRKVIKKRKAEITHERRLSESGIQEVGLKKRFAFLDMLIKTSLDGEKLSDEEIREEVDTFMFAGHDTTSAALSFILWCLSWDQNVQEKTYQELKEVFSDPGEAITIRKLSELKYMEKVIKETLRLFPIAPMLFRDLHEDMKLSGGMIAPKGSTLAIAVFISQRNPKYWPDPLKFDPERFDPENIQSRHPYAYVPFSAGPRNCIGQKFAMLEMKAILAHLLCAYKIFPGAENQEINLTMEVTLVPVGGVPVKIVKRDSTI